MKKKITSININVELDRNRIPENINWNATDGDVKNQEAKAFLLSIWDAKKIETLILQKKIIEKFQVAHLVELFKRDE